MGLVADRIKETATTTGTGNFTLAGAVAGFRTFTSVFPNGAEIYYCIEAQIPGEWEVGVGILSGGTTLIRDQVYASSNSNALVSFSAGTKNVFCTLPSIQFQSMGFNLAMKANLAGN
jgi:hypothetical protein